MSHSVISLIDPLVIFFRSSKFILNIQFGCPAAANNELNLSKELSMRISIVFKQKYSKRIMKYINNNFFIEEKNIKNLVKKFSTPLYCYSYKNLKLNIENFKNIFKQISPLICFSVKSNSNILLLKEIKKLGLGADVVSKGELFASLKAGINKKKIVFSGVGKTRAEIEYAIKQKIFQII